jgi:hypothetical protein
MPQAPLTHSQALVGFLSFVCLFLGVVCSVFVPRCVDQAKLRRENDGKLVRMMNNPWLPRRVLTPTGTKIWLVRNILLVAGLTFVAAYCVMQ